jgi:hypothetical protein
MTCPVIDRGTGDRPVSRYLSPCAWGVSPVSVGRVPLSVPWHKGTHGGYIGSLCPLFPPGAGAKEAPAGPVRASRARLSPTPCRRTDRTITGRNVRYRKLRPEALERPESGANPQGVQSALLPTFQDDRPRSQAILAGQVTL